MTKPEFKAWLSGLEKGIECQTPTVYGYSELIKIISAKVDEIEVPYIPKYPTFDNTPMRPIGTIMPPIDHT